MADSAGGVRLAEVGLMRVIRGERRARVRRRVVAMAASLVVLFVLALGQSFGAFAAGSPSRPIDRQLSHYVLFAFDTLNFKGAQTAGRGIITGGDVGANGIDSTPDNSDAILDICANDKVTMDPGSQLNADTMRISHLCNVWDVFANKLVAGSDVVPQNSGPNSFSARILSAKPSFPSFSCNAANPFILVKGGTATLPPGVYGNIVLQDDTTTTLQPGVHTMCDLQIGKHAAVNTVAGTELRIEKTFSVSNDTTFGPQCDVPVYVRADGASGANDVAVNF
jgi:hypothetical protein